MSIYVVGGYVRDYLLGIDPQDTDFVVVGWSPDDLRRFGLTHNLNFDKVVGADFPVFLDQYGREWALARRERKTDSGYHGFAVEFSPDVTLTEDLMRRDLTINAMACEVMSFGDDGTVVVNTDRIIDPHNGATDLEEGVLRHVSYAFAEDPVRVLRLARFRARWNFDVDPTTRELVQQMCDRGELDNLTAERVWAEVEKLWKDTTNLAYDGLPLVFFDELSRTDALKIIFPTLAKFWPTVKNQRNAINASESAKEGIAVLVSAFPFLTDIAQFSNELKMPSAIAAFALKFKRLLNFIGLQGHQDPERIASMFLELDLYRDKNFMSDAHMTSLNFTDNDDLVSIVFDLEQLYDEAKVYGFDDLTDDQKESLRGPEISQAINDLRREVITAARQGA